MHLKPKISFSYCPKIEDNLSFILFDCDFPTGPYLLWKMY